VNRRENNQLKSEVVEVVEDVEDEQGGQQWALSGRRQRRGRVAEIFFAETGVTLLLVTLFHAHVIHDEVVDDQLLGAHSPHPLLG